ncbi:MAG: hypothetical protein WCI05_04235 [Myxococcales bacterium]
MNEELSLEDHREAFAEVAFLLDLFAVTVTDLMGGATASVGRIAGRDMARKIPIMLTDPTPETVLEALTKHLIRGFELRPTVAEDGADVTFGRCAIRECCQLRRLELGGAMCTLFHYYLDGVVNELLRRPTKSSIVETGDTCRIHLRVR